MIKITKYYKKTSLSKYIYLKYFISERVDVFVLSTNFSFLE